MRLAIRAVTPGWAPSSSSRRWNTQISSVLALTLATLGLLVAAATPASAAQACSAVEIAGGSWFDGGGVDVHSNGTHQGTGGSCAPLSTANPSAQDGFGWQCVELATRLYAVKGWGVVHADGGKAAGAYRYGAKYIPEGSPGLQFHANGSGYLPLPGDLIIESFSSGWGHVSIVDRIVGSSVYAVEQNASVTGRHTYTMTGSTLTGQYGSSVRGVMHSPANTATGGAPPWTTDGSFIQIDGRPEIYRIVGGAPTYVSTWAPFGGSEPTTSISQASFDLLPTVPIDGTFVLSGQGGQVYRIAGGAPVYVSTWAAFGGPQPTMTIDQAAIDNAGRGGVWDHLRYRPADGTFVLGAQRGEVYRFAGGAPLYVSTWSPFAGPQPTVVVDQAVLDGSVGASGPLSHTRLTPADGTFLTGEPSGRVFRVTSGIAAWVSSWAVLGGPKPTVEVNDADLDHAGGEAPWQHLSGATSEWIINASSVPNRATGDLVLGRPMLASASRSFDDR